MLRGSRFRHPKSRRWYGGIAILYLIMVAVVISQGTKILLVLPIITIYLGMSLGVMEWIYRRRDPEGYERPWRRS